MFFNAKIIKTHKKNDGLIRSVVEATNPQLLSLIVFVTHQPPPKKEAWEGIKPNDALVDFSRAIAEKNIKENRRAANNLLYNQIMNARSTVSSTLTETAAFSELMHRSLTPDFIESLKIFRTSASCQQLILKYIQEPSEIIPYLIHDDVKVRDYAFVRQNEIESNPDQHQEIVDTWINSNNMEWHRAVKWISEHTYSFTPAWKVHEHEVEVTAGVLETHKSRFKEHRGTIKERILDKEIEIGDRNPKEEQKKISLLIKSDDPHLENYGVELFKKTNSRSRKAFNFVRELITS